MDHNITFSNIRYQLLYPEVRSIAASEVTQWARDEWYNNASTYKCTACGATWTANSVPPDGEDACWPAHGNMEPVYPEGEVQPSDVAEAIEYLSDLGVATFAAYDDNASDDEDEATSSDGGPPYDHATATGMYDHD